MPVYEYQCAECGKTEDAYRKIDERHDGPFCHGAMSLRISPVRGHVENIAYESPIDGRPILNKRARQEDLRRNSCREWEGLEVERKEAARRQKHDEQAFDAKVEQWVGETYRNLPLETKQALESL